MFTHVDFQTKLLSTTLPIGLMYVSNKGKSTFYVRELKTGDFREYKICIHNQSSKYLMRCIHN